MTYFKLLDEFLHRRYTVMNYYKQFQFLNTYGCFIVEDMKRKDKLAKHLLDAFYNPAYKFCRDRLNRQYDNYELDE